MTGKQKKSDNDIMMIIRRSGRIHHLDHRTIASMYTELRELVDLL